MIEVICEIASAHGGDVEKLLQLLDAADDADTDWVKIQVFDFESLVAGENSSFADLKTIELSPAEWKQVFAHGAKLAPRLIAEVYDMPSLKLARVEEGIDAYKIPTADLGDRAFVDAVCREGKPVFIGVGGATTEEIDAIVEQVRGYPVVELVLLHGFQNFPTRLDDSLLARIRWLQERYGCRVGFADHVDAGDAEISRTLPAMAMSAGTTVIEKHLTLDRAAQGFDYYSALNPDEFVSFVSHMRRMYAAVGLANDGRLTDAEIVYREKMKKFAVSAEPISCGTPVGESALEYRRTSKPGLSRKDVVRVRDARFCMDVPAGTIIEETHFE